MSDFIYSKNRIEKGKLTREIQKIYHDDKPLVQEYHGGWGSLAVSQNLYNGFHPYETKDYIFVVIGGPILSYRENEFLKENRGNTGTKAIFSKWLKNDIVWDKDLSGPFAIFVINKKSFNVHIVTDLMSFIPVYIYQESDDMIVSTHVDILANVSKRINNIDVVSYADFILHSVVTFPYTVYKGIYQINPASEHDITYETNEINTHSYWGPTEEYRYNSIEDAAIELRENLQKYVKSITDNVDDIAQFISGGEDSRTLSALLCGYPREAFIFLDSMNREGEVARKAANAYGADFKLKTRTKTHYINIIPECSDLVGSGSQYHHAHTFGFHKSCKLINYSAVFGGLFADALLKGARITKIRGSKRFPFIPDIKDPNHSSCDTANSSILIPEILNELTKRRVAHLSYVKSFRNESAEEWFELWPSSMNMNIPNLHANRRLFRSYEPFMANDIVKLSAAIPQEWKLNRKLFHRAVKPLLKPTKWLLHGDGRLPYFTWRINTIVQFIIWASRQVGKRTGLIKGNQGPWGEWRKVLKSKDWERTIEKYSSGFDEISSVFREKDINKIMNKSNLSIFQKLNLMQSLYQVSNKD